MGLGGFHLHVRTGLENEHLSEEYMELMKDTVVKAKDEEMLAWLYDEDRWPSGAAGGEFDKTVPAIFTDEPQFIRKGVLNNSFDKMNITMPWTDKVPELYKKAYGEDIFDTLPEVFWDKPDSAPSVHRYRYHDFIAELFASSFADTVGGLTDGEHEVGIKLYTHRYNSFGPLHLVNVNEKWHGPGAWRSEGINWSYEYVLRTTGILKAPGISVASEK